MLIDESLEIAHKQQIIASLRGLLTEKQLKIYSNFLDVEMPEMASEAPGY